MGSVSAKVSSNGQVSIPAEIRHRWLAESVLVIDRGVYAIVRPIPTDTVANLRGAYAGPGPALNAARRADRDAEDSEGSERRGR